jgi:hypothetical protein
MEVSLHDLKNLYDTFYIIDGDENLLAKETEKNHKNLIWTPANDMQFLFVYDDMSKLSEVDKSMLTNLIQAGMKMGMHMIASVSLHQNQDFNFDEILNEIKPTRVIFWGGHSEAAHSIIAKGAIKIAYVLSVNKYPNEKELKVQLWQTIQQLLPA